VSTAPPAELVRRYGPEQLAVFTDEEVERFLGPVGGPSAPWEVAGPAVAWELLYRIEPGLYERLVAGERMHPGVLAWLPDRVACAVEVGAGTGRLTVELAPRCDRLVAVEPAAPLRSRLEARVSRLSGVEVCEGFFERLPVEDGVADMAVACSAFTCEAGHGGDEGLAEMLRVCAPGGLVVVIWPDDPAWLVARGFAHVEFPGEMAVEFGSVDEALELARVFSPEAVGWIEGSGSSRVPFEVLGTNGPRDLCWRRA